jgi:ABC-type multidrug transport system fused ATPase/permease subunit
LMMVAGPVASGKSNLLKSLLGELTIRSGTCTVPFHKAYVPQTPWTALGTVRDNIIFGKPYDESLYRQVRYNNFNLHIQSHYTGNPSLCVFSKMIEGDPCMCFRTRLETYGRW